jgi:hypothetical protein
MNNFGHSMIGNAGYIDTGQSGFATTTDINATINGANN